MGGAFTFAPRRMRKPSSVYGVSALYRGVKFISRNK